MQRPVHVRRLRAHAQVASAKKDDEMPAWQARELEFARYDEARGPDTAGADGPGGGGGGGVGGGLM